MLIQQNLKIACCIILAISIFHRRFHVKNTHKLTQILATGYGRADSALGTLLVMQSSPMIHQSSVTMFCRGSRATRSEVNSTFRCAVGREDEPLRSETPSYHPTPTLTESMVAAATRQHRTHGGMMTCQFLEIAVRALSESDLDMETCGGEDAVGRWVEWVEQGFKYGLQTQH